MEPWYLKFAAELESAKHFERERITARALSSRYHAQRAVSVLSEGERSHSVVTGYAALWPHIVPSWYELVVMKLPKDPLHDSELWIRLHEIIGFVKPEQTVFVVTDHLALIRRLSELNFMPVNFRTKPDVLAWASQHHIVCKLPGSIHSEGDPTQFDGRKWLFVR